MVLHSSSLRECVEVTTVFEALPASALTSMVLVMTLLAALAVGVAGSAASVFESTTVLVRVLVTVISSRWYSAAAVGCVTASLAALMCSTMLDVQSLELVVVRSDRF